MPPPHPRPPTPTPPPPRRQGWEIDFTPQATRWFMSLNGRDAERITGALNQLERKGPTLRRPVAAPIVGSRHHGMKELRAIGGHQRALFAFGPDRRAIVLIGGDKTNNWEGLVQAEHPRGRQALRPAPAEPRKGGTMDDQGTTSWRALRRQRPLNDERIAAYEQLMELGLKLAAGEEVTVSALERQIAKLGGELEVSAVFADERITLLGGDDSVEHT
jgi:hypothetical protein